MTPDDELVARYGDRFEQRVADGMLTQANERVTGVPEYLGMRITEVGPGWCVCVIGLRPELQNPFGAAHGAVVASLVDHVLGSAVFPLVPLGTWPATLEFKLNYLAAARGGVAVSEYSPSEVKHAIAGYGKADKHQMQEMVRLILNLTSTPQPDDAADALAIALCHAQTSPFMERTRAAAALADHC